MKQTTVDMIVSAVTAAGMLLIGYLIIRLVLHFASKALAHSKVDGVLHTFFLNSAKVVMWILLLLTVLNYLGIPPTAFLTVLGAAGVAVALALKDSLGNFAGGILIILTKPFSKGDLIEEAEIMGTVQQIDLLYTTMATLDNKIITVPNGKLANSVIVNHTRAEKRRVDCTFTVDYQTDIAQAKEILLNVAAQNEMICAEPAPLAGVAEHRDSAVALALKVWVKTEDYWDVYYYLQENVKLAFDVADIRIPYPQMDVHLKK